MTSSGSVAREKGTILLDTDGADVVSVSIPGPNVFDGIPDDGNYLVGSTSRLPDPEYKPIFASLWSVDFINGQSHWFRTDPMDTPGFVGVIGEYHDPFALFPDAGLATYPEFGRFGLAQVTIGSGQVFHVPVCFSLACVPESRAVALALVALAMAWRFGNRDLGNTRPKFN